MSAINSKAGGEPKSEPQLVEGLNEKGFFNEQSAKGGCSVRVAVRVRPLLPKEIAAGESTCTHCDAAKNSILVGVDSQFCFDRIFGIDSKQEDVFDVCVKNLMLGSFYGYNSTVLAYGQTGSGKTYTMGTDAALAVSREGQGIVPRVIRLMFDEIERRKGSKEFIVKVAFIEIYNEEIKDLLDPQGQGKIVIRELTRGMPSLCGQREEQVADYDSLFKMLERGALNRRTRATLMNEGSSRSHAIFTINIEQHTIDDLYQKDAAGQSEHSPAASPTSPQEGQEFTTAKFHFVDLAGSERIKKTGAEGDSLHEGISINKALFVLGKVINALTDETGRSSYKPYRESNLTRILQDSLGGNARTTMIACVSPAESNQEETLSTLRYACKARSIKNKPVVNHDPTTTLISQLQQQVYDLQRELGRYKKGGTIPLPLKAADVSAAPEFAGDKELKAEVAAFKRQNESLKNSLSQAEDLLRKREIDCLNVEKQRDILQLQNEKFKAHIQKVSPTELETLTTGAGEGLSVVDEYRRQIAELQTTASKKDLEHKELQSKYEEECRNANAQSEQMFKLNQEMQQLKRTLVRLRKEETRRPASHRPSPVKASLEGHDSGQWLSTELDDQLKEVNELFINELAQSLGSLIPEPAAAKTARTEEPETSKAPTDGAATGPGSSPEKVESSVPAEVEAQAEAEVEAELESETAGESEKESELGKEMKETLNKVDVDINEREKMLEQIKEKHKEMQNNLITIMKQQCHKKVEELERELEKLRTDQDKAIQIAPKDTRSNVELQYKKKIGEYEGRLKEFKKSEAHEQQLLKQTAEQESRIQALSEVISKMKQQKVELARQMKKERETYERTKREQAKEALKLRQESIKQKMMINKLTREKERAARLKEAVKRETCPLPKKEQVSTYKEYVNEFTTRLVTLRQETMQIQKEEGRQKGIQSRLDEEHKTLCKLRVEGEKLATMRKELNPATDCDRIQAVELEFEQNEKTAADLQATIDNMEATLRYHEEKVARIEHSRTQLRSQLAWYAGVAESQFVRKREGEVGTGHEQYDHDAVRRLGRRADQAQRARRAGQGRRRADCESSDKYRGMRRVNQSLQQLTKEQTLLREECRSEIARMEREHTEKELALVAEMESLKGNCSEPNIGGMELRRNSSSGAVETRLRQDSAKDKPEDKSSVDFIRKELEKCKKRNADIIKENGKLCNQIVELKVQNETLQKTVTTQSRKEQSSKGAKASSQPLGSSSTPKFVSLNAKRQDRKKTQNHTGRSTETAGNTNNRSLVTISTNENAGDGNRSADPSPKGGSATTTKDLSAEIEAIEKERRTLENPPAAPVELSPEQKDSTVSAGLPKTGEVEEDKKAEQVFVPTKTAAILKATTVKLTTCRANPRLGTKYALADDSRASRRLPTAMEIIKDRSKSPIDGRVAQELAKGKAASGTTPERRRLSVVTQGTSLAASGAPVATQPVFEELSKPSKWKCVSSQEYHALGIFSLAAFEQYLISSSNVLKVWDINKKAVTAELPNTISKALYADPLHKFLIGTNEQTGTVTIWSLPDLVAVSTIETGMKHVRALYLDGHILFIGGCCSTGALQLWDINTMAKLCERERSQDSDIFSILKKGPVVYYGGRNRCINRLNMDSLETLSALSPTHYGAVNALANIGDTLVSGCREYLFRTWDYETGKEKYPEVKRTTTLNAVQTDKDEQMLYAAGKDGNIKVWRIKEERLQEEDAMAHTKSVNALARICTSHSTAFASAGDDKLVKIWRRQES